MATIKLKRRAAGGAAGAPASLATAEPAYNEVDDVVYIGYGDNGSGVATSIRAIAGAGLFATKQYVTDQMAGAGAGDMLKSVYDPNNDGKVTSAVNADVAPWAGVSGKPATITSLAALTTAADQVIYSSGANTLAVAALTAFGRSLIDDADAAAARTTLGLGSIATLSSVANANLANMADASIKGRASGAGVGAPTDLTGAQVKTILALVKGDVGLGNVDNTSDANKPVSTAQQTALNAKADLASPALTGTPTAPTASLGTNTSQIATMAAVNAAVDAARSGLDAKASVRVATTGNISLTGTQTIDGVAVVAGDRVLVKNQTTGSQNGIYVVAAGAWTRAPDADADAEVTSGMFTFVEAGTTNADSGWVLSTLDPVVVGTTAMVFVQFSGAGQIVSGTGMTKSGNTLNVVGTANRITANADSIDIASNYVGQTSITTVGTIGTGTWQATVIAGAYGGLGQAITGIADGALTKRSGAQIVAAVAGTDYLSPASTIDGGTF